MQTFVPSKASQAGPPGPAPTIETGNVSAVPAGQAPTIIVREIGQDAYALDFGIPSGVPGAPGQAATIQPGNVTALASNAAPTATLRALGNGVYALDLGIPAGSKGNPGDAGSTPTLQAGNVTALANGQAPTAALRALGGNVYALDLGIPAGAAGANGTPAVAATLAQILAGTANAFVDAAGLKSSSAPVALADAASVAMDMALGRIFTLTLGGNRTLANPSNLAPGQSGLLVVTQDATGSRTLSYGSAWKFPGGAPTLSTAAGAVDVIAYYVLANGTILASFQGTFQ